MDCGDSQIIVFGSQSLDDFTCLESDGFDVAQPHQKGTQVDVCRLYTSFFILFILKYIFTL